MAELAEPRWVERPDNCLGCGYSLAGLPTDQAGQLCCPECGQSAPPSHLVLEGTSNRTGGSRKRRYLGIALVIFAFLFTQLIGVFFLFARYLIIPGLVTIAAGLAYIILSSPRERRGVERFVITPRGLARTPIHIPTGAIKVDTFLIPWSPHSRYTLKPAGPFWTTLRITDSPDGRARRTVFDGGFRCTPESLHAVIQELDRCIRGVLPSTPHSPGAPTAPNA